MNEVINVGAIDEKYALLKEELVRIGGCVGSNRFIKDKDGRSVETTEDRFLWLYDVFLELSMLELSCAGGNVASQQVEFARDFAAKTGHESIVDVVQDLYGKDGADYGWESVVAAKSSSVRRMTAVMKKNLRAQADSFAEAFATAVAANGGNALETLRQSATLSLVACAQADGEVTPEEEDKMTNCFIVAIINDIARRLANFRFKKNQ